MGAIAAYLGDAEEPTAMVGAMVRAAPHRGSRAAYVTLGRCTLGGSWTDEVPDTEIGTSDDLAVAIVGMVDNRVELAESLSTLGSHDARERMDGGLVDLAARAYRAYGADFPARMRGVFSGIVSDGSTAYCFRDQLGYKPLFYRHDGRAFWAASEPKQVVAGAGIPREPDLDVVEAIFYRSLDDTSPSALQGVERLPKMMGLEVDTSTARRRRYWFPERLLETASIPDSQLQDRFDDLMTTAVRRSLRGHDVIFLSGGIDSPAVAAYAAPLHRDLHGGPLTAVSIVYPRHPSVDESRYVRLLADHYDMPLHVFEQDANLTDDFRRWTAIADTPYRAAALAQYEEAYRRVRALGSINILTGELAEFLMAIQWFTLDHYLSQGRLRSAWRELRAHRAKGRSWLGVLRRAGRATASGHVIKAVDRLRRKRSPLVPLWVDVRMATDEDPVPVRDRWRRSQLGAFVGPGTSLEADEICQAVCDVTVRRPWTDVDLWEFMLSLPAEQKFPDLRSKSLVRRLLRNRVPDEILDRTDKTVFDDAARDRIDYDLLGQLLMEPPYHMPGVDYRLLGHLITERRLGLVDYEWARDLANVHAFLDQWASDIGAPWTGPPNRTAPQSEGSTVR
jgi:asparagine synthase (glutamine-hydrolysing)